MPSVLPILKHPHAMLRRRCDEVPLVDDAVRRLADDMVATMAAMQGVGLAAPQVGRPLRLLVAQVEGVELRLANPRILAREGEIVLEEGCLSVPNMRAPVRRALRVTVGGTDMDGKAQEVVAEELLAVCLQHEIDHLDGVLFFDHLSNFRRTRLLQKYKKQTQAQA